VLVNRKITFSNAQYRYGLTRIDIKIIDIKLYQILRLKYHFTYKKMKET